MDESLEEIGKEEEAYGQFEKLDTREALKHRGKRGYHRVLQHVDTARTPEDDKLLQTILTDIHQIRNELDHLREETTTDGFDDRPERAPLANTPQNSQFNLNTNSSVFSIEEFPASTSPAPEGEIGLSSLASLEIESLSTVELKPMTEANMEKVGMLDSDELKEFDLDSLAMPGQERFNDVDIDIPVEDFPADLETVSDDIVPQEHNLSLSEHSEQTQNTAVEEYEPVTPVEIETETILRDELVPLQEVVEPVSMEEPVSVKKVSETASEEAIQEAEAPFRPMSNKQVERPVGEDQHIDVLAEDNLSQIIPEDKVTVASELTSLPSSDKLVDLLSQPVDNLPNQDIEVVIPVGPMFDGIFSDILEESSSEIEEEENHEEQKDTLESELQDQDIDTKQPVEQEEESVVETEQPVNEQEQELIPMPGDILEPNSIDLSEDETGQIEDIEVSSHVASYEQEEIVPQQELTESLPLLDEENEAVTEEEEQEDNTQEESEAQAEIVLEDAASTEDGFHELQGALEETDQLEEEQEDVLELATEAEISEEQPKAEDIENELLTELEEPVDRETDYVKEEDSTVDFEDKGHLESAPTDLHSKDSQDPYIEEASSTEDYIPVQTQINDIVSMEDPEVVNEIADQVLSTDVLDALERTTQLGLEKSAPVAENMTLFSHDQDLLNDLIGFIAFFEESFAKLPQPKQMRLTNEEGYDAYLRVKGKVERESLRQVTSDMLSNLDFAEITTDETPQEEMTTLARYREDAMQRGRIPFVLELNRETLIAQIVVLSEDEVNLEEADEQWVSFLRDFLCSEGFVISDDLHTILISSRPLEMSENDYLNGLINDASDVFGVQPDENLFEPFFIPLDNQMVKKLSPLIE